ncbi:putative hydrolase of the HAD superfamily [Micromonospora pisi]|uniref:Putative hydrolase of the HAD superfamily n=1 Tax=Micromonospora pisi TaxID=589240 RepID=A0A495JVI8_9ACTN|nr:HAD family hydrolase [Micromonospora pisi]RKR92159.1 putative hydrolase of the HAD superfamily [Micromonospora pisi]
MNLRGVLLDLDGTLVDHEAAVTEALRAWLPTLGVAATDEVIAAWSTAQERHLVAWRERRISFQEQRRRRLRDFLPTIGVPFADDEEQLDRVFGGYLHWYERSWRAFEDAAETLETLARMGLRTAVLTNGTVEQQHAKLARVGLLERVGPVYTAEELGVAKPATGAFLAACQRWGLPAGAVVHVGDRHDLDVVAARAAGLHAVHLDRHNEGSADERLRITSLRELSGLLRLFTDRGPCGPRSSEPLAELEVGAVLRPVLE